MTSIRSDLTRRTFLQASAAALAAPLVVPASVLRAGHSAPGNRIGIGLIACGSIINDFHLPTLLAMEDLQIVALCDPFANKRASTRRRIEEAYARRRRDGSFTGVAEFGDFRELLARPEVDAVFIGTPDHWHAPITIAAANAGKDIYCEKPLTDTVAAGRAVVEAVRRSGRILQVGHQQRSDGRFRLACELVRNGRIGKLETILVTVPGGRDSGPMPPVKPVPADLDYEMWLGPAPWQPYCPERVVNNWWWYMSDYGIGFQAGWGVHHLDIAQWGNDTERSGPVEVEGTATFPREGLCDTAIAWETRFRYANGVKVVFTSGGESVKFIGTEGWVLVGRWGIDAGPKSLLTSRIGPREIHLYESREHHQNFAECIRTRREPAVNVEVGHRSNTLCLLSDIAIRLGRKLAWNPAKECFPDDLTANRMLSRAWRSPWHA